MKFDFEAVRLSESFFRHPTVGGPVDPRTPQSGLSRRYRVSWLLSAVALALGLSACDSGGTVDPGGPEAPQIQVSAASVSLTAANSDAEGTLSEVLVSSMAGGTPLTALEVGAPVYAGGASGWLTASLTSEVAPATLRLRAIATGLSPGQYSATVPLRSRISGVNPVTVTVQVTVTAPVPRTLAVRIQPSGAVSGLPFAVQPTIEFRAANGTVVPGSGTVTATVVGVDGTTRGQSTVSVQNGIAEFRDLGVSGAGVYGLRFTSGTLDQALSESFSVTQEFAELGLVREPGQARAGQPFGVQPQLEVRDHAGLRIESGPWATQRVIAALASGTGTLIGSVEVISQDGRATFTDLGIFGSGNHSVRFGTGTGIGVNSSVLPVLSEPVSTLALVTLPNGIFSGAAFQVQPVVELRDAAGDLTPTPARVRITLAPGPSGSAGQEAGGVRLIGETEVDAVNGVARFRNVGVEGTGPVALGFESGTVRNEPRDEVRVTPVQRVSELRLDPQPGSAISTVPFGIQPTVRAFDDGGRPVLGNDGIERFVTARLNSGPGTLLGTVSTKIVNGEARFTDLAIGGLGAHAVLFESEGAVVISETFPVIGRPAASMSIRDQPSGAVSGSIMTSPPSVLLLDVEGEISPLPQDVTVELASGTGTLVGTTTVTAVNGVATFANLRIDGSGAHTLRFTSGALTSVTSSTVTVTQIATTLEISTPASGAVSGQAFTVQPQLRVLDGAGLPVVTGSGATLVLTATVESGAGTLVGTATATASNGFATFTNLGIQGVGAHRIRFATTAPMLSVVSAELQVAALPAEQIGIRTQPGGAVSGSVLGTQPVVELRDAGGVLTPVPGNVTVELASGTGTLVGTTTVTAVNGVATFANLRIDGSGAHTLRFTSGALTSVTSSALTVTQIATTLEISTLASGAVSGQAFTVQPQLRVLDGAGLPVVTGSGATLVVTATVESGAGTLVGTAMATASNGVATFTNLGIQGVGAHRIRFATTAPILSVVSAELQVAALPAEQIGIRTQPGGAVSGSVLGTQPVVELRDAGGVLTPVSGDVTVELASGTGTLVGTTTVTAVNGVATFANLRIDGSGAHTLRFTSGTLTSVTSSAVTVTQIATTLEISTPASGAVSGQAFTVQPQLRVLDGAGLPVVTGSGATLVVTATVESGAGTLVGTVTATAANGVATFTNLGIQGVGAHRIRFATTGPGLSVLQAELQVIEVPVPSLAMVSQPAGAVSGSPFSTQPVVRLLDPDGNPSNAEILVTASLVSGSGTLDGTLAVQSVNGVVTFTNLRVDGVGPHRLEFTAPGHNAVTSAEFLSQGIVVAVGQTATLPATKGSTLDIPVLVGLEHIGAANVAAITMTISWDPSILTYVSNSAGNWLDVSGDPATVIVNAGNAAAQGSLQITGFTNEATITSFILRNLRLTAAEVGSTTVSVAVSTVGNVDAATLLGQTTVRNLLVTIGN